MPVQPRQKIASAKSGSSRPLCQNSLGTYERKFNDSPIKTVVTANRGTAGKCPCPSRRNRSRKILPTQIPMQNSANLINGSNFTQSFRVGEADPNQERSAGGNIAAVQHNAARPKQLRQVRSACPRSARNGNNR